MMKYNDSSDSISLQVQRYQWVDAKIIIQKNIQSVFNQLNITTSDTPSDSGQIPSTKIMRNEKNNDYDTPTWINMITINQAETR